MTPFLRGKNLYIDGLNWFIFLYMYSTHTYNNLLYIRTVSVFLSVVIINCCPQFYRSSLLSVSS
jgi:hypothetical protein